MRPIRTPPALPACRCELAHGSDVMPPSLARGAVMGRPRREAHSIMTHAGRLLREDSPSGMQSADEQVALRSRHTTLVGAIKRHLELPLTAEEQAAEDRFRSRDSTGCL